MTLEEAEKVLKEIYKNTKIDDSRTRVALEAILNYIENESIPKEKVKECLEDIYDYFDHIGQPSEDMEFLEEWKKKILEE